MDQSCQVKINRLCSHCLAILAGSQMQQTSCNEPLVFRQPAIDCELAPMPMVAISNEAVMKLRYRVIFQTQEREY
ncbi:MAG: hypothetical protein CMJ19_17325 [Phycisphaeraceae bacterium]|nr:hypothetical protein [Phycisphaeraceae bacterium]